MFRLWRLQILEVFKNTLPTKLYWILFPIEDPRQAVETAKRILTKEKLDKQLTRHTSYSPFMSIGEGQNCRRVSFDTREELGDKVDKLVVMKGKLAAKDSGRTRQFKLQIHQSRGKGQNRGYSQRNYQNRYSQIIDRIVETEDNSGKTEVDTYLSKIIGEIISGKIQEIMADKIAEENRETTITGMIVMIKAGINLEKGNFPEVMTVTELGVQAIVD